MSEEDVQDEWGSLETYILYGAQKELYVISSVMYHVTHFFPINFFPTLKYSVNIS